MKFFSIRWKLSLALVGLSFGLVSAYIVLARETFESDKISYVFDSEQSQLEGIEKDWSAQIENGIFLSKSILSTYDSKNHALNPVGQALFEGQKVVLAFELTDLNTGHAIASVIPGDVQFPKLETNQKNLGGERLNVEALSSNELLLSVLQGSRDSAQSALFRILLHIEPHYPKMKSTDFILSQSGKVLNDSSSGGTRFKTLIEEIARDRSEKTEILKHQGRDFLVSHLATRFGDFQLTAIVSKESALGALDLLYRRSVIFVFFSGFITIILVVFLSGRITHRLEILTDAARRLRKGDFTEMPPIASRDEVGILSRAFSEATIEIKRLLVETREKARMESEIKSASVIQETLLPKQTSFETAEGLNLSGLLMTATECSGDWWYYLDSKDRLIVAIGDATGHGTPAALMTAAARSAFAIFEREQMTLDQMMTTWNQIASACSGGKVFMTAQLVEISKSSGEVKMINACHEWPCLFRGQGSSVGWDQSLEFDKNITLGESHGGDWKKTSFTLNPGDYLLLYSDGVFAVENDKQETLNDRRLAKAIAKTLSAPHQLAGGQAGSLSLIQIVKDILTQHASLAQLPDDVTVVAIHHAPPFAPDQAIVSTLSRI